MSHLPKLNTMRSGVFRLANAEYLQRIANNGNQLQTPTPTQSVKYSNTPTENPNNSQNPIIDQYNANEKNKLNSRLKDIEITMNEFAMRLDKNKNKVPDEFKKMSDNYHNLNNRLYSLEINVSKLHTKDYAEFSAVCDAKNNEIKEAFLKEYSAVYDAKINELKEDFSKLSTNVLLAIIGCFVNGVSIYLWVFT